MMEIFERIFEAARFPAFSKIRRSASRWGQWSPATSVGNKKQSVSNARTSLAKITQKQKHWHKTRKIEFTLILLWMMRSYVNVLYQKGDYQKINHWTNINRRKNVFISKNLNMQKVIQRGKLITTPIVSELYSSL